MEEELTPAPHEQASEFSSVPEEAVLELKYLQDKANEIRAQIERVIVGQDEMVELLLIGLLTGGHVLLEGVPGVAKTLTAKLLSRTINAGFSRIQFTPDLMPSDVLGTSIFNLKTSEFTFSKGPIFSNIILIDEINRSPAKTQAALFEVMEEKQVTIDGETYTMEFPFFVVATQNPVEQEGTYKLPEAQLDRFLFKIKMPYPSLQEEKKILRRFKNVGSKVSEAEIQPVLNPEELSRCAVAINQVHISEQLLDYIAELIHNTRNNPDLFLGASPRASLSIMTAAKALAGISGKSFVTPDDIQTVCYPVLNHRLIMSSEKELEGVDIEDIIKGIIRQVEVPR